MSYKTTLAALSAAVLAVACQSATEPLPSDPPVAFAAGGAKTTSPTGESSTAWSDATGRERFRPEYHGGPVMHGTSAVYLIWYGNWTGNTATAILTDLVSNLGSSSYFRAVTKYPDASGSAPSGGLIYAGAISDGYSHGPSLTKADVATIVRTSVESGQLPFDLAAVYAVLISADVTVGGAFSGYCAYHDSTPLSGYPIEYVLVGNPQRAPTSCGPPIQQFIGPNDNLGADGMASLLAAVLANTVTDPTLTSWYDRNGLEMADKCAWTYGTTYVSANGTLANVRLGQRDYLLQQLWVPSKNGGACALSTP